MWVSQALEETMSDVAGVLIEAQKTATSLMAFFALKAEKLALTSALKIFFWTAPAKAGLWRHRGVATPLVPR